MDTANKHTVGGISGLMLLKCLSIKGLDIISGCELYGRKSYIELLCIYNEETPTMLGKLKALVNTALTGKDLKEYTILIHGLKGSCYNVCANALGKYAETLEKAARGEDKQFITANTECFIETVGILLEKLNYVFGVNSHA